ncbi:MAG TPA: metal ABC transporter substrate-binding protein [Feifaniaceae bacterium]|nr:metal ABC transporter substrate-binding protein [Feifaniaceae bacterium]
MKKWSILLLCLLAAVALAACGSAQPSAQADDQLAVTVTFDAIKEFAEAVGGDQVAVSVIIPTGTEPHDFEPKAQDLVGLSSADVFIYNGLGMETWVDDAVSAAGNEKLIVVDASTGADAIVNTDEGEIAEHGQYDPHLWLGIKGAETEITNIKDAFVAADPDNKDYYETNCADYIAQLETLFNEYSAKFATVEKKSFVTGHAAFGYLCRDFGLTQNSVEDVFAEGEPSAQQLAELVEYCKQNGVTTIFAEEMASPEISQTLANEVGASVKTIYTMESAEDDLSYLERMADNLSEIYESLSK